MRASFSHFSKVFFVGLGIGLIIALGIYMYTQSWTDEETSQADSVTAEFDRVAIIQAVQQQARLETVTTTVQRDVTVTLNLGDFQLFDFTLLESKRQQEISATARVGAGVDLSIMNEDDFDFDEETQTATLTLPAPEVFYVEIIEDQTDLLRDDATTLFFFQTFLNQDQKDDLNEYLFQQVLQQSKIATKQAACADDILQKASKNAIEAITSLLESSGFNMVKVETTPGVC